MASKYGSFFNTQTEQTRKRIKTNINQFAMITTTNNNEILFDDLALIASMYRSGQSVNASLMYNDCTNNIHDCTNNFYPTIEDEKTDTAKIA
jgi:hypothetical protein